MNPRTHRLTVSAVILAAALAPVLDVVASGGRVYAATSGAAVSTPAPSQTRQAIAPGLRIGIATPRHEPRPSRSTAGALPVGQAVYPVPANAVHVSPAGSDAVGTGSASAPVRTIAHALAVVSAGGTIVLHAGTYHESLGYIAKKVTIQNAPGQAAWLDGSETLSGFSASEGTWSAPYAWTFDSGPTFKQGQADYTQTNWNFINSAHPMAAHPDQVWIDGAAQTQVASAAEVSAGTFFVDAANHRLVLGSDPTHHQVRGATLQQALRLGGAGSVLRGFGVRNYANSQYMMGEVVSYAPDVRVENMEIDNAATGGLGIYRADNRVSATTVSGAGMTGVLGNNADGLVLDHVLVRGSNTEKFNFAPAAAGIKVSRTAGLTLQDSTVVDNFATGLWTDEDARDIVVSGNLFRGNARNAIMLELGARARVVNNRLVGNGAWGSESLLVSDTAKAQIWNNTIVGPRAAIRMAQDDRTRANQPGVGDARPDAIDADMTWQTTGTIIGNNVLQDDGAPAETLPEGRGKVANYAVVHAQNYGGAVNHQMVEAENGNLVARLAGPKFVMVWQPAGGPFTAFGTWEQYRSAVPDQGALSHGTDTSVVSDDGMTVAPSALAQVTAVTAAGDIAVLMPHGAGRVGAL